MRQFLWPPRFNSSQIASTSSNIRSFPVLTTKWSFTYMQTPPPLVSLLSFLNMLYPGIDTSLFLYWSPCLKYHNKMRYTYILTNITRMLQSLMQHEGLCVWVLHPHFSCDDCKNMCNDYTPDCMKDDWENWLNLRHTRHDVPADI